MQNDMFHLNAENQGQIKDFMAYILNMPMIREQGDKGDYEKVKCGIEYLRYVLRVYCISLDAEVEERKGNE